MILRWSFLRRLIQDGLLAKTAYFMPKFEHKHNDELFKYITGFELWTFILTDYAN